MKKQPMVSVMILCYNYADMLCKALAACAAQTFRDFEIVMINNGSTDHTGQVWQEFCREHPDIETVYVHVEPNNGPLNGWNKGLEAARGTYVLFNDADDWMEPGCLEMLVARAVETGADRVVGGYQEVNADGTVTRIRLPAKGVRLMTTMVQSTIFRREIIMRHSIFYDANVKFFFPHDAWYICRFTLNETNRAQTVDKCLYNYYNNMGSETHAKMDVHRFYEVLARPYIDFTKELMGKTQDTELKTEMEYLMLRNLFASYISTYQDNPEEADDYYLQVRRKLTEELPGYYKNRMLWNLNNGYERGGTMGSMAVGLLDRFSAKGLIRLLARCGRNSKLVRRNESEQKKG